ncbi:MAG: hypothetical protein EXR95_07055 [Gemmatimonadetes bacterium]|nr:hypothetical protein [Gemmatimonadota bacterium]
MSQAETLLAPPPDPEAERLVRSLVAVAGQDQVRAVLLFGSRMVQASPDRFSAYDLVVVAERYRAFYAALERAGLSNRSPGLQALLNRGLAPNVIALAPEGWDGGSVAKVMVLEPAALERGLGSSAPDHFLKGRLVQKVALLHARDAEAARWVGELVEGARANLLEWVGPFLEGAFTPAEAARRMLQLSYGGEVRPEADDRVLDVFEAQRPWIEEMMTRVLEGAVAAGTVQRDGSAYRLAHAPDERQRKRVRRYFLRSKARATVRWLKHVVTFDNWLDYIARKLERRTGMRVEITPWERRLPYLLLWPKVARVLRARPARLDRDGASTGSPPRAQP